MAASGSGRAFSNLRRFALLADALAPASLEERRHVVASTAVPAEDLNVVQDAEVADGNDVAIFECLDVLFGYCGRSALESLDGLDSVVEAFLGPLLGPFDP